MTRWPRRIVTPEHPVPPEHLRQYRFADWADATETPPTHWAPGDWWMWHRIRAWRRCLVARRQWADTNGADYDKAFLR